MPKRPESARVRAAVAAGDPPASADFPDDDEHWHAAQDHWLSKWSVRVLPEGPPRRRQWDDRVKEHARLVAEAARGQDEALLGFALALQGAPGGAAHRAGLPKPLAKLAAPHSYAIAVWLLAGLRGAPTPQGRPRPAKEPAGAATPLWTRRRWSMKASMPRAGAILIASGTSPRKGGIPPQQTATGARRCTGQHMAGTRPRYGCSWPPGSLTAPTWTDGRRSIRWSKRATWAWRSC